MQWDDLSQITVHYLGSVGYRSHTSTVFSYSYSNWSTTTSTILGAGLRGEGVLSCNTNLRVA